MTSHKIRPTIDLLLRSSFKDILRNILGSTTLIKIKMDRFEFNPKQHKRKCVGQGNPSALTLTLRDRGAQQVGKGRINKPRK